MILTPRINTKQSQRLVMTQQLSQAISLLQMSSLDVAGVIAQEAERNPLLSLDPAEPEPVDHRDVNTPRCEEPAVGGVSGRSDVTPSVRGQDGQADGPTPGSTGQLSGPKPLREHLLEQIALVHCRPMARRLAEYLVDELDRHGYLRCNLGRIKERLCDHDGLVDEALAVLQCCDPAGVGAQSLQECLTIQLRDRGRLTPAMAALVAHLDDLVAVRLNRLRRLCGVSHDELSRMIAELRSLHPRPCSGIGFAPVPAHSPDVLVAARSDGGYAVELNPAALPRVLMDRQYLADIGASGDAEVRSFVSACKQRVNWLHRALDQRAATVLKVTTEIVRRQSGFLRDGVPGLEPMTMAEIAEKTKIHESTVSRAVANKTLSCERGIFDLKLFFSHAVSASDDRAPVSVESVRFRIRELIETEDPQQVLSDEKIARIFNSDGLGIARRTIAKYREAMRIPPSNLRRRIKLANRANAG